MGLLLGRPDPQSPTTLIVADAFPLPIEGFETRVIADDQAVVNHMISLHECLERTRQERFMGWYHSHPFDVGDHSHCFLSQTDLSTQLQWQRAEDPHGNPFVAIVLDPLRSVHVGSPQLKAFRAYPPEYQSNIDYQCPDGSIELSEQKRLQKWGSCWSRYYELDIDYFMSSTSRTILEDLTQSYLWMNGFKRANEIQKANHWQDLAYNLSRSSSEAAAAALTASQDGCPNLPRAASGFVAAAASSFSSSSLTSAGTHTSAVVSPTTLPQLDSNVQKLQAAATQELTQATLRQVQRSVFKTPLSDFGSYSEST
jgi:proteasome lid subunit RPN8/RPN11